MENKINLPFLIPNLKKSSENILPQISEVIESQIYVDGKNVHKLEKKLSLRYNRKVVGVSNGTVGLIIALDSILKEKREVIVPSLSFSATIQAIIHAGAKPVFADVLEENWTLDVNDVEKKITSKTGAIMPVNLFGVPCDVESFKEISEKYNLPIIYDSCQAFGAKTQNGEIGTFGDIEVFSLDASKILSAGLGGFITIKDEEIYNKIVQSKNFGNNSEKIPLIRGINARMHEFNAILANSSLKDFEYNLITIKKIVRQYKNILSGIDKIKMQKIDDKFASPQYFGVFFDHPDSNIAYKIQKALIDKGIGTRIYNPSDLHKNPIFSKEDVSLNITEKMCRKILCLPTHNKVESCHIELIKQIMMEILK